MTPPAKKSCTAAASVAAPAPSSATKQIQLLETEASPRIVTGFPLDGPPSYIVDLLTRLKTGFGAHYIPRELRDVIPAPRSDERAYSEFHGLTIGELELLADWALEIETEALECCRYTQDENSHNHGIVAPFLKGVFPRTSVFQSKNVQSNSFDPRILPQLRSSRKIDKKIDYAVCLRLDDDRLIAFAQLMVARDLPLGIMTESHMQKLPVQVGMEVKQAKGSLDEAKLQILVYISACARKMDQLSKDLNLPIFSFIVHGSVWHMYVSFKKDDELLVERINELHVSVSSAADVLLLRDLFRRLSAYLQEVYLPIYLNAVRFPARGKKIPHSHRKWRPRTTKPNACFPSPKHTPEFHFSPASTSLSHVTVFGEGSSTLGS